MSRFATTPEPPYYAVIFTAQRTDAEAGYEGTAARMLALAAEQPGYLGVESTRDAAGLGITVSYWESLEAIAGWKRHLEHREAQSRGRREWYSHFELRVAKVERASRGP
jgi:heme-degrading monooxygenase HmoA